ncbi:ABC transporter ATP-binding protein [Mycetocola tolaasinivorans]|uniref:ABC transporter ATP-binding protein n=1 Tax=Mycetocola tolaasinivorans TaxID=76635 RepID=A0A3L7A1X7_9MICO|nr:ABC transporter ATP-binding protein [Mycetocola tolaasinivorans]RLP74084.1 ABC transporter ATP-binding protein [Mycetocola tolaasinivorans]
MTTREYTGPLAEVEGLRVEFERADGSRITAVHDLGFSVEPGKITALVGESGSGKSVSARSLIGLAGQGARVGAERLDVLGRDARAFTDRQWRSIRGREVGLILQDALTSLDPLRPIGREISGALTAHRWGTRDTRRARVLDALAEAGLDQPERYVRARSGELSGGQRQRALIAQALAAGPQLLIADEPTTALDMTVQAQILDLFERLRDRGHGILLISHDLGVVGRLADTVLVLGEGRVVESGSAREVLTAPRAEYTRALLRAIPDPSRRGQRLSAAPPLAIEGRAGAPVPASTAGDVTADTAVSARGVGRTYTARGGFALADISFDVPRGTTLGIVGESGSGKSTLARLLGALDTPNTGEITVFGEPWSALSNRERVPVRHRVQVVYQDPLSSFDPRHRVITILLDALRVNADRPGGITDRAAQRARALELLTQVGLSTDLADRHPLSLSGGQRQRVAIARALACAPDVLILDEPVSALDVSVQAQVLDLLQDLQRALGLTYLFISHDLAVIHHVSDRVLVLRHGRAVEIGEADQVLQHPENAYTRELVAAIPHPLPTP